jgi:hypothetical protein
MEIRCRRRSALAVASALGVLVLAGLGGEPGIGHPNEQGVRA